MMGMNDFQYEIGKTYAIEERPILCYRGFHFCKKLSDVFQYYSVFGGKSRFFKVRALIDKTMWNACQVDILFGEKYETIKCVAKEIQIVSEISHKELLEAARSVYKYVESTEDLSYVSYKDMMRFKIKNMLLCKNFKDTFTESYINDYLDNKCMDENIFLHIMLTLNSGASYDLMVHELINVKKK